MMGQIQRKQWNGLTVLQGQDLPRNGGGTSRGEHRTEQGDRREVERGAQEANIDENGQRNNTYLYPLTLWGS